MLLFIPGSRTIDTLMLPSIARLRSHATADDGCENESATSHEGQAPKAKMLTLPSVACIVTCPAIVRAFTL